MVDPGAIGTGKRRRSLKRTLAYAAIPTTLALVTLEGAFRVYALVQDATEVRRQYRSLAQSPAYASKSWFSREFAASTCAMETGYYTPRGTHLVLHKDYMDRLVTVQDGIRGTTGFDPRGLAPGQKPRILFALGGSTTYCQQVPDEFTWASQLQKRLAELPETRDIKVVNCGISAAVSLEEVQRLEYEISRNNVPNYCIFFNGINDANQGVVNGNPGHTVRETAQSYAGQGLFSTLRAIASISVAARTIYHSIVSTQRENEPPPRPQAEVRKLALAVADVYEQNMLRAREICDRYHIGMMVFLQPHVFAINRPWTNYEKAAADRTRKDYQDALRVCYPLLQEKVERLKHRGILAYDISDAFDANREPIFVDNLFHVESTGNGLIADAILRHALPVLRSSPLLGELALPGAPESRARR